MTEQKKQLEAARLACPAPYTNFKSGDLPKFFLDAVSKGLSRKYFGEKRIIEAVGDAYDHPGSALMSGQPVFVLQPYYVDAKMLVACEQFASTCGLKCTVDAASQHFPGRTFSIIFSK